MNKGAKISTILDGRIKNKSGQYPVKIRIYYPATKRKRLYPVVVDGNNLYANKKEFSILKDINNTSSSALQYAEQFTHAKVSMIATVPFDFGEFNKKYYRGAVDKDNLYTRYGEKILSLTNDGKHTTADTYRGSMRSIKLYTGEDTMLPLVSITKRWLEGYEKFMLGNGKSLSTIGFYLRNLRHLINVAIEDGDIDHSPFKKYKIPIGRNIKKALTAEQLGELMGLDAANEHQTRSRDFFLLLIAFEGMNVRDLCKLKWSNIEGDTLTYSRSKTFERTKLEKDIVIDTYAVKMFKQYGSGSGSDYIFDVMETDDDSMAIHRKVKAFTRFMNQHLKRLVKGSSLPKDIGTQFSRHTALTMAALEHGIEFASEVAQHSDLSVTKRYFAGFASETRKSFGKSLNDLISGTNG